MAETSAPELADWLLARGRSAVSTSEAAELIGVPEDQVRVRLNRAVHAHRLIAPSRGLWIAVPPEYRTWGAPPALDFLDQLMGHLGREYYVGWLSAAELHGAAHQRPQVTQVAVDSPVEDRDFGRSRLRFFTGTETASLPRVRRNTTTGQVWVSTPELTALDLVAWPRRGGGLSNVATILYELAESQPLDPAVLIDLCRGHFAGTVLRRLGYLLDVVDAEVDTDPLAEAVAQAPLARPAMLSPTRPRRGPADARWALQINDDVEPDL